MERYGRSSRDNNTSNKVREPWKSYNHSYFVGESLPCSPVSGFSWPPRSYNCSFCKREFRSAQALGGHMNVHRRDRARLRQSPPWDPPLCNPNPSPTSDPVPNLNISLPSCTTETKVSPVTYTVPSLISPLTHFPSSLPSSSSPTLSAGPFRSRGDELKATKAVKALFGVKDQLKGFMEEDMVGMSRKDREVVRLDLEIGVSEGLEEDLDLELRLGYN